MKVIVHRHSQHVYYARVLPPFAIIIPFVKMQTVVLISAKY